MTNVTSSDESQSGEKRSTTVEDYLLLIYILQRDGEPVVGARLAELLRVTPPTVTNTLKRMTRDGLVAMDEGKTRLTEAGWQTACVVMRRHMLMELLMARILPWSKLHSEAHNLEHAVSSLAETALMEELGNPETCPHGNPMPGSEAAVSAWIPLTRIGVGQTVTVRRVHELGEEDGELLDFLESHHLKPGANAVVREILPFNQTITLDVSGQSVVLGYAAARFVYVELCD
jgi:DtxR family transcriptional regulator, Mn-dependent transcriptional regulator